MLNGTIDKLITARADQPTETLSNDTELCFRVWANKPVYQEDEKPWKLVACFYFLTECLDYIAYCQDNGADVIFQSPADTKMIKHTDRRVVYKTKEIS